MYILHELTVYHYGTSFMFIQLLTLRQNYCLFSNMEVENRIWLHAQCNRFCFWSSSADFYRQLPLILGIMFRGKA